MWGSTQQSWIGDGNIEKTNVQVSERLGLPTTPQELKQQAVANKKRIRNRVYQQSAGYKDTRALAKMTKDHRMGKVDAKKRHRSGKVPLGESAKSSVGVKGPNKPRKPPTCSICKVVGHTKARCKMPPERKRRDLNLVDWDADKLERADVYSIKPKKRRKALALADFDNWV